MTYSLNYTNGPPRCGSYPFTNLAQDFKIPVELVWQYAWHLKCGAFGYPDGVDPNESQGVAVERQINSKLGFVKFDRFMGQISELLGIDW